MGGGLGEVLNRPVRIRGIDVAEPVDVLLDPELRCVLGFEVHCRDGVNRFLPWLASELEPEQLSVELPVTLLDGPQLDYYREHSLALNALRRLPVAGLDGSAARVEDVIVDSRGLVQALVLADRDRTRAIAPDLVLVGPDQLVVSDRPEAPLPEASEALARG